ncbi:hypothetical protein LUZ60_014374 [Juncus effusus]|nr:hypothetical protein LUZ60_014374 [Juncus effusus]
MASAQAFVVFFLALAIATEAKDYVVGDSQGWSTGVDYNTWASANTFNVGDSLVFQYGALHSVNEVSESDYSACSASNAINSYGNQNTKITLATPGTRYFICGASGHCSEGMKLAVTVSSAAASASGGSFSPVTPNQGTISPPSTTYPYGPYQPGNTRPLGSGTGMDKGRRFYGVLFGVFSLTSFVIWG